MEKTRTYSRVSLTILVLVLVLVEVGFTPSCAVLAFTIKFVCISPLEGVISLFCPLANHLASDISNITTIRKMPWKYKWALPTPISAKHNNAHHVMPWYFIFYNIMIDNMTWYGMAWHTLHRTICHVIDMTWHDMTWHDMTSIFHCSVFSI